MMGENVHFCMKFDEKLKKVSEKPQKRMDRILIILGLALLVASCSSYFVIDVFGQQNLQLDCPKNAYHGLDNQGNAACRDIQTNQILEPESVIVINSNSEQTKSNTWLMNDSEIVEIVINDDQIMIIGIIIFVGIAGVIGVAVKKRKLEIFQKLSLGGMEIFQKLSLGGIPKEQVRDRQYGKCNMCFTPPTKWKYDYIDGNKRNNDLNNCQGLCSNCYSIKIERDSRANIYQK